LLFYKYYSEYTGKPEEEHKMEKWDEVMREIFGKVKSTVCIELNELKQLVSFEGKNVDALFETLKS